jgi:hypothetical protein
MAPRAHRSGGLQNWLTEIEYRATLSGASTRLVTARTGHLRTASSTEFLFSTLIDVHVPRDRFTHTISSQMV